MLDISAKEGDRIGLSEGRVDFRYYPMMIKKMNDKDKINNENDDKEYDNKEILQYISMKNCTDKENESG